MNFFHKMLINGQFARDATEKFSNIRSNRRLKHIGWGVFGIILIMQLIIIFMMDYLSDRTLLWLEGFIGLCAIIYAIIVTLIVYRINKLYIKERFDPRERHYKDAMAYHERYCSQLNKTHKSDIPDVDGDSSD